MLAFDTAHVFCGTVCVCEQVNRSKSSEVNRRRAHAREASIAKARQASAKPEFKTSFAQEELLTEAVETEKANLRWLLTAQRAARAREVTTKGPGRAAAAIRVGSSRSAPTTVTQIHESSMCMYASRSIRWLTVYILLFFVAVPR
jgi:hypothetical protein